MPGKQHTYKLVYFDVKWRAEPVRILFHYFDVPFEDVRLSGEEWGKIKGEDQPFEQLPYLELDGGKTVLAESIAILRYLSKTLGDGFIGRTKADAAKCDMVIYAANDMYIPMYFAKNASAEEKDAKMEMFTSIASRFLRSAERMLKKNGGDHFVGDSITWADLYVMYIIWQLEDFQQSLFSKKDHKTLISFYKKMRDLPTIKEYVHETLPSNLG